MTRAAAHRGARRPAAFAAAALILALVLPAAAHEFWVAPSDWSVQPGARATILANVGDQLPGANSYTTLVNPPYLRTGNQSYWASLSFQLAR